MDLRKKEPDARRISRITLGINSRILAIELRYRRFGFAAIEVPKELLDAGVRTFRSPEHIVEALRPLIKLFTPAVIVVKIADHNDMKYRGDMASIVRSVRSEAALGPIPVIRVTNKWVRNALGGDARNKEHVARLVVREFPSLSWKLPPTREHRPWVSEGWNMAIFDAAAIGIVFFKNQSLVDTAES